jgi:hypothetical protein
VSARLASQTQKSIGISNGMRTASIAAVSGGVVTLAISGGLVSSGVGVLKSYTPVVGDTVAVFRQDSSWLVLGSIAASTIAARGQLTGTSLITVAGVASIVVPVTFGATFPDPPVVISNIDSGAGTTARWVPRSIAITTVGFSIFAFAADGALGTFSNIPVSWVATART